MRFFKNLRKNPRSSLKKINVKKLKITKVELKEYQYEVRKLC